MNRAKITSLLLKILAGVIIFSLGAMGALYAFLQRGPEELARSYLKEYERKTGLNISFDTLHVALLPMPAAGIGNLKISGGDFELEAAWISLTPSIWRLLRGDITPAKIIALRPKLFIKSESLFDNPKKFIKDAEKLFKNDGSSKSGPYLPNGMDFKIVEGGVQALGGPERKASLGGLNAALELNEEGGLSGTAGFAFLRFFESGKPKIAVEGVSLEGSCSLLSFVETESRLKASGVIRSPGLLRRAVFKSEFEYSDYDWSCNLDAGLELNLDGEILPASYRGRIFSLADSLEIISRRSEFALDADSGSAELKLRLPARGQGWDLTGKLFMRRLSLTQWLGFARSLPPGLQMALDNITNASMDFTLTEKYLKASGIKADSTGATFTGSGGVPDFAHPVVELDLKSDLANLGLAVPESLIKSPQPVYFPYQPLTPKSGIPLKEGEEGVGYDIRLASKKLIYGPYIINNAKLRIYPGRMDTTRLEDVLMDASGGFYGGSVSAHCILGADPSLPVYISANLKDLNMAAFYKAKPVLPIKKGIFQSEGKVFSKGKTLVEFLANLNGPVSASGRQVLLEGGMSEPLQKLALKSHLKGGQIIKNGVSFGGKWDLVAGAGGFSASLGAEGRLAFSESGLGVNALPSVLKIDFAEKMAFIPPKSSFSVKSVLSGNTSARQFSMDKLSMELPGARLSGKLALNIKNMNCSGELGANIQDSAKLLKFFSISGVSAPKAFASARMDSVCNITEKSASFNKLKLQAGGLDASGSVSVLFQKTPLLEFDLSVNEIDFERHFGGSERRGRGGWDFNWLKDFNLKGLLKTGHFRGWGISASRASVPVELKNGRLSVPDLRADLYGARLKAQIEADFSRNILFKSIISVNEFKLEEAARDQKIESELAGRASIDASLSADLSGPGQIPAKLDGIWNFKVTAGYFQGRDKNGKLKGDKTRFDLARASGRMKGGRLESSDILLKNQDMQAAGEGWLNLNSRKIDCKLNVNMKNLPDFPLYIYGPMSDPTTSVGAGRMVLNALGGIGSGIGSLFGNLVKGVGNIFK